MPDFEVKITGITKLLKKLKASSRSDVIESSLFRAGENLASWVKRERLSGPRPQFLGIVTGWLRANISASRPIRVGSQYIERIGTNVVYGPTHEFGDPGRNIPKRPFLSPAIEDRNNQQMVIDILTKNINLAIESQ